MPSASDPDTEPLWDAASLVRAAGGFADGEVAGSITGISIDTRSLVAGDLFVALQDQRDGHDFVSAAFERGAAAALVSTRYARRPGDGLLVRVPDPLEGLRSMAIAARARLGTQARVIAVTGSAGKTGTTAMLRACLARNGATHAPEKSLNNHWGVPLTLARMPAETQFAVLEIGMNHAGEISPLTRLVRPHIALVTNVLPVHIANFTDGEIGVAHAKAEIFDGLDPGGVAILPLDSAHIAILEDAAIRQRARVITFGMSRAADVHPTVIDLGSDGSDVTLESGESWRVGTPGQHIAVNSLAVAAVLRLLGETADPPFRMTDALGAVARVHPGAGRGARGHYSVTHPDGRSADIVLIDESYNANPASMAAALGVLGRTSPTRGGRRIAVLGDMRELGDLGPALHVALCDPIRTNAIDLVFACGPLMQGLFETLPQDVRGAWRETSEGLVAALIGGLTTGDIVMVKGSLGTNMAPLIAAIKSSDNAVRSRAHSEDEASVVP